MTSRESLESTLEKLCSSKLENLDEMDKFLETHSQQKLKQGDINHLNRPITSNEIEAVIKNSLQRRAHNLVNHCQILPNL
jgi:hypothetical protein